MSVRLMAAVWASDLPHVERDVALAVADFANDAGDSIFPSQAHLAWKLAITDRQVRRGLRGLIDRGVLVPVSGARGGRRPVVYRFDAGRLPTRPPWREPGPPVRVESTNPDSPSALTRTTSPGTPDTQSDVTINRTINGTNKRARNLSISGSEQGSTGNEHEHPLAKYSRRS